MALWSCLWEIILIELIKIRRSGQCGWYDSLVWDPGLYKNQEESRAHTHTHVLLLPDKTWCAWLPQASAARQTIPQDGEPKQTCPHWRCFGQGMILTREKSPSQVPVANARAHCGGCLMVFCHRFHPFSRLPSVCLVWIPWQWSQELWS